MPRPKKSAHLILRKERRDKNGRVTHKATWLIKDGKDQVSTGCGTDDIVGAEKALQEYLTLKHMGAPLPDDAAASELPIADVLRHYILQKGETVKDQYDLKLRFKALLHFWGDKVVSDITKKSCEEYTELHTPASARRQLEDLRAAVNMAIEDGHCRERVVIKLPEKPQGRVAFLTRDQVAALVWTAYRRRKTYTFGKRSAEDKRGETVQTKGHPSRHVARFILAAVYTGSRSSRIHQASFVKEIGRPYIDVDAGIFYRSWQGEEVARNKRAPAIRIPGRLLAHMRRWKRLGAKYLVEFDDRPVDPKKAFRLLVREVLEEEGDGVVRHTLRHTAATWLMQAGLPVNEIAGFLGMSVEVLIDTYGHHHPDHQGGVSAAFTSGKAGRIAA